MTYMRIYESSTLDESPELDNYSASAQDPVIYTLPVKGNSNNNSGTVINRRLVNLLRQRSVKKRAKITFRR